MESLISSSSVPPILGSKGVSASSFETSRLRAMTKLLVHTSPLIQVSSVRIAPMPGARLEVLTYVAPEGSTVDAFVAAAGDHLLVFVTGVVDGRREVVSFGISPKPSADLAVVAQQRARAALESIDEGGLVAVSSAMLRGLSIPEALTAREAAASEGKARPRPSIMPTALLADLPAEDAARIPYLDDALLYVQALHDGRPPSGVIAEARGISRASANNRVLLARKAGLLTSARGRTAGGELTNDARRLLAWRAERTTE